MVAHRTHHTAVKDFISVVRHALEMIGRSLAMQILQATMLRQPLAAAFLGEQTIQQFITEELNLFKDLDTPYRQMEYIKECIGIVSPFKIKLGRRSESYEDDDGVVYTFKEKDRHGVFFDIVNMLKQCIDAPGQVGDEILGASNKWSVGTANLDKSDRIEDITDGTLFREHPSLSQPASPDRVRVALVLSMDSIDPHTTIGYTRGRNKTCCGSASIINLPIEMRTNHDNILPCFMVHASDIKEWGATRCIGGADMDRVVIPGLENTFGQQMAKLSSGVPVKLRGEDKVLEVHIILSVNDFVENGLLGYESSSPRAAKVCRACDFDQFANDPWRPFSFVTVSRKRRHGDLTLHERTAEEVQRQQEELATLPPAAAAEFRRETGIRVPTCLFDIFPGFDKVKGRPQDIMHSLGGCGVANREGAQMLHYMIKIKGYFTFNKFSSSLEELKDSLEMPIQLPQLHASVLDTDNQGFSKGTLHLKAAEVHEFIRYSEDIIEPLLDEDGSNDPAWRSWKAMVELFNAALQPTFSLVDILALDKYIQKHRVLYGMVGSLYHFVPKHHFVTHVPRDILRCGPARAYWCFPFEAYLRKIKAWIMHSNGKDMLMHAGMMMAMKWALHFDICATDERAAD